MVNKILILSIITLLGLVSCVEKQNFDQLDDLFIEPTIEGSILYVEAPEDVFNQPIVGGSVSQDFNFDGFNEDIFADRVLEGSIIYEIENTTSKELDLTVEFLDEAKLILDTMYIHVDPGPTASVEKEVAYGGASGKNIEIIKNTSSIRVHVQNLGDNTSVSNLSDPKIIFRSMGEFTMRIR